MICLQITIPTKYQRINTQQTKIKTNKYTRRLTYTREILLKLTIQKTEHNGTQNRHKYYQIQKTERDRAQNRHENF